MPRGKKKGDKPIHKPAKQFPVHPEVVKAKEQLISAFMSQPLDVDTYRKAYKRLSHLLVKHHPLESRPIQQLNLRWMHHDVRLGFIHPHPPSWP